MGAKAEMKTLPPAALPPARPSVVIAPPTFTETPGAAAIVTIPAELRLLPCELVLTVPLIARLPPLTVMFTEPPLAAAPADNKDEVSMLPGPLSETEFCENIFTLPEVAPPVVAVVTEPEIVVVPADTTVILPDDSGKPNGVNP